MSKQLEGEKVAVDWSFRYELHVVKYRAGAGKAKRVALLLYTEDDPAVDPDLFNSCVEVLRDTYQRLVTL